MAVAVLDDRHGVKKRFGVEWWPEPAETPANEQTAVYDIDADMLARWQAARTAYLAARAALVGQLERQGWRAGDDGVTDDPRDDSGSAAR